MDIWSTRPKVDEYGKFYQEYVEKVGKGNIFDILNKQMHEIHSLIDKLTIEEANYQYADGKWSVKEVIGHLIDSERIFAYRGLCFSRGEKQNLPGFDQNDYMEEANFDERGLKSLRDEYTALRKATMTLFKSFSKEILRKKGKANGYDCTVRSILFIIVGHERHHLDILKHKYHVG